MSSSWEAIHCRAKDLEFFDDKVEKGPETRFWGAPPSCHTSESVDERYTVIALGDTTLDLMFSFCHSQSYCVSSFHPTCYML